MIIRGQFRELIESEWIVKWPFPDEPGFDVAHSGIKGIREDAPDNIKKIYNEYVEWRKKND